MKWLVGLSAAQTVLLGFVALRVVSLEMRADDIADTADAARLAAQNSAAARPATALAMPASANSAAIDMEDFRALIREEMAPLAAAQTRQLAQPVSTAPQLTPEQIKRAEADFVQELNLARNRGRTSEADISGLYAKIADLPPQARREAMSQLAKAISRGEIDAPL